MITNYYVDAGIPSLELLPPLMVQHAEKLDKVVAAWGKMPEGYQKSLVREVIYSTMDYLVDLGKKWVNNPENKFAAKAILSEIITTEVTHLKTNLYEHSS